MSETHGTTVDILIRLASQGNLQQEQNLQVIVTI